MKLRLIILGLSVLALVSASAGACLYYSSIKQASIKDAERQANARAEMIKSHVLSMFSEYKKPVKTFAGMPEISAALINPDMENIKRADILADHFNKTLDADVCYITDNRGFTIISSNRNKPDSFVGENFSFRPYFQQAVSGTAANYLAVGKTSGRRGVYYSHPVFGSSSKEPLGVAVIKASVKDIEKKLNLDKGEIVLLTSPQDFVFISTRQEWLYGLLWKESGNNASLIAGSGQFGSGPWHWTGLEKDNKGYVKDSRKNKYLMHKTGIEDYKSWNLVYLQNLDIISKKISSPFIRVTGMIVIVLCIFFVFLVLILYLNAAKEIGRREKAEEALRLVQEDLNIYTKELERQVAERTREITGILKYTPDVIYIKDVNERYLLVNSRYEQLFDVKNEEIRGKTASEFMTPELAEEFQASDKKVLREKHSCQVEQKITKNNMVCNYLSVKFPIYDEQGNISGVGGISTDITDLKKNQEQLRQLSGRIIKSQEKERTAIARELHDELGQILTALRMDAVWILNRIKNTDEKAACHASAMRDLIDKSIDDVRSIAIRLRPGVLDDLGLKDALEWFTADFERRTGITCIYEHHNIPDISNTIATTAYRIAQESLTNAARHANATHVDVSLWFQDNILRLTITDDGQGFDTASIYESQELGLAGMRERAGIVGGSLDIESLPGEGTRICFELEIDTQEAP